MTRRQGERRFRWRGRDGWGSPRRGGSGGSGGSGGRGGRRGAGGTGSSGGSGGSGGPDPGLLRWAARLGYVVVLAFATLTSLRWDPDPGAVAERLQGMLRPSVTARDAVDAARNLMLFAGWGLVWMLTSRTGQGWRPVVGAVASGAAASLTVEMVQLFSISRTASVLDLTTNTLGALAGAVILRLTVRSLEARRGRPALFGAPSLLLAGAYGAAVLGEALVPLFRQTPLSGVYGGPVQRLSAALDAFRWTSFADLPWGDVVLFLPAGFMAVAALMEEGRAPGRAAAWTAAIGLGAMVAVEGLRGVLALPIEGGAALLHGGSIAAGGLLAVPILGRLATPVLHTRRPAPGGASPASRRTAVDPAHRRTSGPGGWRGSEGGRVRAFLAGWLVVLALWTLRPYVPETDLAVLASKLGTDWWVPLRFLGMRVDVFSVVDVVTRFFLFLPAGAVLAARPLRSGGSLGAVLPALYVAGLAELAQLFVAGRTLDGTDALVQAAGVLVGWALVRRAGAGPSVRAWAPPSPSSSKAPPPSAGSRHPRLPW